MNIINKLVNKISPVRRKQIKLSFQLLMVALVLGALISYFAQMLIYKTADKLTNAYIGGYEDLSFQ